MTENDAPKGEDPRPIPLVRGVVAFIILLALGCLLLWVGPVSPARLVAGCVSGFVIFAASRLFARRSATASDNTILIGSFIAISVVEDFVGQQYEGLANFLVLGQFAFAFYIVILAFEIFPRPGGRQPLRAQRTGDEHAL